jgi:hypothetical protein
MQKMASIKVETLTKVAQFITLVMPMLAKAKESEALRKQASDAVAAVQAEKTRVKTLISSVLKAASVNEALAAKLQARLVDNPAEIGDVVTKAASRKPIGSPSETVKSASEESADAKFLRRLLENR